LISTFFLSLLVCAPAGAQDAGDAPAEPSTDVLGDPGAAEPAPAPSPTDTAASYGAQSSDTPTSASAPAEPEETEHHGGPYEDPEETYFFLGGFYRHTWIPSWMTETFVQRAPDIDNPQFGLEFSVRKDRFEVIYSAYYADFSAYGPYLANGDPIDQMEIIDSNLWAAMAGVTFLWSSGFSDWFAIEGGIGLGVGYVGGNLWRTEAYPNQNGGWTACQAPTAPNTPGSTQPGEPFDPTRDPALTTSDAYCGAALAPGQISDADGQDGEHYGVKARRWTGGGSVPNVWFRAALQLSLRFKPAHGVVIRADGGFDLFSGFFAGGAFQVGF